MALLGDIDFGNEAGDDVSPEELTSYFVEKNGFERYLSRNEKFLIAMAKKGVGKSALIQWIAHRKGSEPNNLVVKCRGADFYKVQIDVQRPTSHISGWMQSICTLINRHLARSINIAISDDKMSLIEAAEIDGYKERNLIRCLIDRFRLRKFSVEKQPIANELEVAKRVCFDNVWLLIDDLDATFQKRENEIIEMSTFFSACRYLTQDLQGLNIRVTMRSDVWPILRKADESMDKVEQYIQEISWNEVDFRSLLSKRIESQMDELYHSKDTAPNKFKEEDRDYYFIKKVFNSMTWGEKRKNVHQVIYTLSYHRPRWAIQLCKSAQKAALVAGSSFIEDTHIDQIWADFGRNRIDDLVAEHKHQCSEVEELIMGFKKAPNKMNRKDLIQWIKNRITNHITPVIEGNASKKPLEIAKFLFRIGFIVARNESEDGREYEHYNYNEMSSLLSTRTNSEDEFLWEIHPCYRHALDINSVNSAQRQKRLSQKHDPKADRRKRENTIMGDIDNLNDTKNLLAKQRATQERQQIDVGGGVRINKKK